MRRPDLKLDRELLWSAIRGSNDYLYMQGDVRFKSDSDLCSFGRVVDASRGDLSSQAISALRNAERSVTPGAHMSSLHTPT